MSLGKRLAKGIKILSIYLMRSPCFRRLAFSKTMWGLYLFFILGLFLTLKGLWSAEVLDYFKWLGPFFFGSRALDNLSNINITKKDKSDED